MACTGLWNTPLAASTVDTRPWEIWAILKEDSAGHVSKEAQRRQVKGTKQGFERRALYWGNEWIHSDSNVKTKQRSLLLFIQCVPLTTPTGGRLSVLCKVGYHHCLLSLPTCTEPTLPENYHPSPPHWRHALSRKSSHRLRALNSVAEFIIHPPRKVFSIQKQLHGLKRKP